MKLIISDGGRSKAGIKDSRACTVIALASSANITYRAADDIGVAAGRKRNRRFETAKIVAAARKKGFNFSKDFIRKPVTAERFCAERPEGRYIARVSGHAFAVVGSYVLSNQRVSPLSRITHARKLD
jgi:hypothetical protein